MRIEDLTDEDLLKLYHTTRKNINTQPESIGVKLMEEEINKRKIHSCFICEGLATKRAHTGEDRGFFYLCSKEKCKENLELSLGIR